MTHLKHKKVKLAVTLASTALLAGGVASCSDQPAKPQSSNPAPQPISAAKMAGLSKAELKKLLANIETTKAPKPKMGAMCYDMAMPPKRMEYVCPVCGEKTLYAQEVSWKWTYELQDCRRLFNGLPRREAMALDESPFCKKCNPAAKEPALNLVVRFDNGTTNFVPNITSRDLRLLNDFLAGRLLVKDAQDSESPIKEQLPRLRELLGLEKEESKP